MRATAHVVDYTGWEAIDAHERSLGEPVGRPRVKLVSRDEMLQRAGHDHMTNTRPGGQLH